MKKKFQATDSGVPLRNDLVVQTFSAAVEPGPSERMSELKFSSDHQSIQHAEISYIDQEGAIQGQHDLLTLNESIRPSVLHVPEGTVELRIALTLPKTEICDELDTNLKVLGKYPGLFKLGLHVYRINRNRGVPLPTFIIEKTQQLLQLGLGNFLASPSRHVDLREVDESNYEVWKSNCTEQLLAETGFSYPGQFAGLAFIIRLPPGSAAYPDGFARTLQSIFRLKLEQIQLLIIAAGAEAESAREILDGEGCRGAYRIVSSDALSDSTNPRFWYCFMQAGDIIRDHAAWVLSQYAALHPGVPVFYGDHDYLEDGFRHSPEFKPSWNREFYLHDDYIKRSVFLRGDWLSSLRIDLSDPLVIEQLILDAGSMPGACIERIPDVLFSLIPSKDDPTGQDQAEDPTDRQELISDILNYQRIRHRWQVGPESMAGHFLEYLPAEDTSEPMISLIIPSRDQYRLLKKCVESIRTLTRYSNYEIIIVDNGSTDKKALEYLHSLTSDPVCTVLQFPQPFNFSAINNFAFEQAGGDLIGLVNNDIEVCTPGWLHDMAAYFCRDDVGAVGAKLLYGDKKVQHAGVICGVGNVAGHAHRFFRHDDPGYMNRLNTPQEYSAVTAACLLTRSNLYREIGGLNESELAVAYNDIDYCLRLRRAGYKVIYAPQAELIHHESKSRGSEDTPEKFSRYRKERAWMWAHWRDQLLDDEFYNPNLTRVRDDFSLRSPPTLPIMRNDV